MGEPVENEDKEYHARREVPRYALSRPVQVMDKSTGAREYGQLAEISRKGCFIDMNRTMPLGTPLALEIAIEPGKFTTNGTVIYTKAEKGMGIGFKDVLPEQLAILDAWLGENVSCCFFRPGQN